MLVGARSAESPMIQHEELAYEFLRVSRRELTQNLEKIEKAVGLLTPKQVWTRGSEAENSIGNLLLHLSGNVRQWIISGVAQAPDVRDRDAEFAEREVIDPETLLARLRETVTAADIVLSRVSSEQLLEKRRIQVFDLTVMHAIYHCVEHFSGHTGQIIWATKRIKKADLNFYGFLRDPDAPRPTEP